ncbi:MAG: gamma-glutamyltransferase, partial [Acidobacteriota bacterium]
MKRTIALFLFVAIIWPWSLRGASRAPVRARHGIVASVSEIASQVGVDTMKKGGNSVDAAVAVAFTLAVVWPSAGNLGGGGFMVIRDANGKAEVIDYRERAPLAASRDMYLDADGQVIPDSSTLGYRGVGVPGTVAGLALAQKRHGRLHWSDLIEPARKLAKDGFPVSEHLARSLNETRNVRRLSTFPESRRIFLRSGSPFRTGDIFKQPELAATLSRIQKVGARDFYEGKTAELIVSDMKAHGGIITARDLREYEPTIREPLRGTYRGYEILTMPPPSSGGAVLLEMLNILEHFDLSRTGHNSSQELSLLVPAMKLAYSDRASFMGDTDFVKVPIEGIISKKYGDAQTRRVDPEHATPSEEISKGDPAGYESVQTTHFSIIDAEGGMVSNTYTLNDSYGSAATVPGAGFLLNDEMDDFTSKPGVPNLYGLIQSEANAIAPRKR